MTVYLYYGNGNSVTLHHVSTIALKGYREVEITCFGNDPVLHRNVVELKTPGFNFEALPAASMR